MRNRMAMVSAASGKRSNTERCTASTVRPPMIGVSQSRPSMVAVSLSVTSISSSPRASADNGTALAPAAAAARKNLARVSRRDMPSFIRHVDARFQSRKNSDRHIDAAPAIFARVPDGFGNLYHCSFVDRDHVDEDKGDQPHDPAD